MITKFSPYSHIHHPLLYSVRQHFQHLYIYSICNISIISNISNTSNIFNTSKIPNICSISNICLLYADRTDIWVSSIHFDVLPSTYQPSYQSPHIHFLILHLWTPNTNALIQEAYRYIIHNAVSDDLGYLVRGAARNSRQLYL